MKGRTIPTRNQKNPKSAPQSAKPKGDPSFEMFQLLNDLNGDFSKLNYLIDTFVSDMVAFDQTSWETAVRERYNKVCGLAWIARDLSEAFKEDFQETFKVHFKQKAS